MLCILSVLLHVQPPRLGGMTVDFLTYARYVAQIGRLAGICISSLSWRPKEPSLSLPLSLTANARHEHVMNASGMMRHTPERRTQRGTDGQPLTRPPVPQCADAKDSREHVSLPCCPASPIMHITHCKARSFTAYHGWCCPGILLNDMALALPRSLSFILSISFFYFFFILFTLF